MGWDVVPGALDRFALHADSHDDGTETRDEQQRPFPDPSLEVAFRILTKEAAEEPSAPRKSQPHRR